MSTHTVHGCYIASTGKFEFDDTAAGCEGTTITGCLVKSGEHEGQVQITHDYGGCETQYYACLDPATGKFQFEADDGCCEEEVVEATCCGTDCETAPSSIKAVIAGMTNCGSGYAFCDEETNDCLSAEERNGTYILPIFYSFPGSCGYKVETFCACWCCYGDPPVPWNHEQEYSVGIGTDPFGSVSAIAGSMAFTGQKVVENYGNCDICDNLPVIIQNELTCDSVREPWASSRYRSETGTCTVSKV